MCDLCKLSEISSWYYQDDSWVIIECITCKMPMIVYRQHTMEVSLDEVKRILIQAKLKFDNVKIRFNQRKILDHFHIHLLL